MSRKVGMVFMLAVGLLSVSNSRAQTALLKPADQVAIAIKHLATLPPASRPHVRYISLANVADRDTYVRLVNFWLATFSRSPVIEQSPLIDGCLVPVYFDRLVVAREESDRRADLERWGIAWETLLVDGEHPESYFHLPVEVQEHGAGKTKIELQPGPWCPAVASLDGDCLTRGAIITADHFLRYATEQDHYYRFAGIDAKGGLPGVLARLGIDKRSVEELEAYVAANILVSGVTDKQRRVVVYPGPFGRLYMTLDVDHDSAATSPFRYLRGFRADASEIIAFKSNGLHLFLVLDGQGRVQSVVNDKIAKDSRGDGVLVPGRSCVTCHRESGLRPITNDQLAIPIRTDDPFDALSHGRVYLSDRMPHWLERDRQDYDRAVALATNGWTAGQVSEKMAEVLDAYEADHSLAWVARHLGVEEARLRRSVSGTADPIITALLAGMRVKEGSLWGSWPELAGATR